MMSIANFLIMQVLPEFIRHRRSDRSAVNFEFDIDPFIGVLSIGGPTAH